MKNPRTKLPLDTIHHYHQQSKHHLEGYARGPETIDWSAQPDPFRQFQGTHQIQLGFHAQQIPWTYQQLFTPGSIPAADINAANIAILLQLSMAISAWKEYEGSRWSLRCNPSSGNLHPTETYLIFPETVDPLINGGVYHYCSYRHTLEQRCRLNKASSQAPAQFFLAFSSIFWREAWKYGERAFRYCQLDLGHALAAIRMAAACLGWRVKLMDCDDVSISRLLGLDRDSDFEKAEREHPEALFCVFTDSENTVNPDNVSQEQLTSLLTETEKGHWQGKANILDTNHLYQWPLIDEVAEAALKHPGEQLPGVNEQVTDAFPKLICPDSALPAADLILRRRSAQAFDGQTPIEQQQLFDIMDKCLPRSNTPPWDALPLPARINLVLFVHRVNGLSPGLYILLRNKQLKSQLQNTFPEAITWQRVSQAPEHLPFYQLLQVNCRKAAAMLSCHQAIAADSAFSLAMLSDFDLSLAEGPWRYRQLFWEAGVIGQVLYLEAEVINMRGTGIGCFFDDAVHQMLNIDDSRWQSLYHFTLGAAITDPRLRTIPAYQHLLT